MKTKINLFIIFAFAFFMACGGGEDSSTSSSAESSKSSQSEEAEVEGNPKGIGEVKNVDLNEEINVTMVFEGKQIYEMKCASCHKLTDKRVVGPGFQGVTNRRTPEWIMNMITNVDVMLEEDPVARKLLEECLTRMPNQGLSVGDARDVLEFLRQNDESRIGKRDRAAQ